MLISIGVVFLNDVGVASTLNSGSSPLDLAEDMSLYFLNILRLAIQWEHLRLQNISGYGIFNDPNRSSFTPILKTICACLDLPQPIYNCIDESDNITFVLVPKPNKPNAFFFVGDKGNNIKESCESASQKMVLFLVRQFKIVVSDVNLELRKNLEKCVQLFKIKHDDLEAIEKETFIPQSREFTPIEVLDYGNNYVAINFLDLLRVVVNRFQIIITPIEIIRIDESKFKSWFTVSRSGGVGHVLCLIGDICGSVSAAKQSLAKIAVTHFMHEYQFEVKDVNYCFLDVCRLALKYERQNYISMKERVYGLNEEECPVPYVVEQDLLTPRGPKQTIIAKNLAPLPPKKEKISASW